tara:strand:- start:46 stop:255 length:210 start_codon:yes stop_codon:yes gene_type:complete
MTKEEICNICGMVGIDDDHDIYDCTEKWEEDNGIRKGQWMIDWMKRLAEKEKKEPYVSSFAKWSQSVEK